MPPKAKLKRSKTSCLKCRARKNKCGALPPETCAYCAKYGYLCEWPEGDRRTLRYMQPGWGPASSRHEKDAADGDGNGGTGRGSDAGQLGESSRSPPALPQATQPTLEPPVQAGSSSLNPWDTHSTGYDPGMGPDDWRRWLFASAAASPTQNDGVVVDMDASVRALLEGGFNNDQVRETIERLGTGDSSSTTLGAIRIKYLRSHGRTAYVPGVLEVPIRIQLQSQTPGTLGPSSPAQIRSQTSFNVLLHLIDVFQTHFGQFYPSIDCQELRDSLIVDPVPSFLLNCVAATAARLSQFLDRTKPDVAGDEFYERANAMIGNVLRLPLTETVMGFVLLSVCADSVSGQWMMAGIATRMALDLGLHRLDPRNDENSRQNRLCLWSVVMLDYVVSFGVGRSPSLRAQIITQSLPEDMQGSPFPYAARMMRSYGTLIDLLNSEDPSVMSLTENIGRERVSIMREYQNLPQNMQWSAENLRIHHASGNASIFLYLHLWVHTVLSKSVTIPQGAPMDELSRSGAKMVCEYLTLCGAINPLIHHAVPMTGQPLFTAALVIMQDLRWQRRQRSRASSPTAEAQMTITVQESIANGQIDIIRRVLADSVAYWRAQVYVQKALEQCIRVDEPDRVWIEDDSYAVDVYDWSLPGRYRTDGSQVN